MDNERNFLKARDHHRSGRLSEAEAIYRAILLTETEHANALYFLGRIANERGKLAEAAKLIEKSLLASPDHPERANNLGAIYQELGNFEAAIQWFKTATGGGAGQAEAHLNLATIRHGEGKLAEAEAGYRRAIKAKPDLAAAHSNLSVLLRLTDRSDEAGHSAARAVELDENSPKAHNNLGVIRHEQNHLLEAFQCFQRATEIDPKYAEAYNNMGSVFRDNEQNDAALASFKKAIKLAPNLADAHNNLGSLLQRQGDYDGALACFEKALDLEADFPPALSNMGGISHRKNRQDEAVQFFKRALAIDPDYPEAHFNLSEVMLLTQRDLREGWKEHRWRWKKREFHNQFRDFGVPLWDGSDLMGKRIAVWGEQGIGEEIMYAGMIPDLIKAGAEILVECDPRLVPLFERSFEKVKCLARTEEPPKLDESLDFHMPIGDLGYWYRPAIDSFPARQFYLKANSKRRDTFRASYLDGGDSILIGLSWFSRNPEIGWEKSIDLKDWLPLFRVPGVTFVDLQYGDTFAQREALQKQTEIEIIHDDTVDQLVDLDAFASQVAAMDMVVSISNTTAHMAGALGVPTWILLSEVPLWRWFQDRADSPWYPSLRLFRQRQSEKWERILGEVALALSDKIPVQQ